MKRMRNKQEKEKKEAEEGRKAGLEEGKKEGLQEGKREGLEEGIIKLSRKLGKEDTEILSLLQEELQIDEEQAKLILEKYQQ